MSTFEIFLFFVVTPILILITVVMYIIVKKTSKEHIQHAESTEKHFKKSNANLSSLNSRVESLSDTISTDIVTPLKEVNEKVNSLGVEATFKNFLALLDEWGIRYDQIGEKAVSMIYLIDDVSVTYLINLDTKRELLKFEAFCYAFDSVSDDIYKIINELNIQITVGHIELHKESEKYIPMYNYALLLANNKLSKHSFIETIRFIGFSMTAIFKKEKIFEFKIIAIQFNDYLRYSIGEEEYKKLEEKVKKETEEKKEEKN